MASQGFPAPFRAAPEAHGANSGFASPGVQNGVMSALVDAHDSGDMPGLIREGDAGVATPSAHPFLEEPLTPQTASSSLHLPFLISNSSASPSSWQPSSCLFLAHDTCQSPNSNPRSHADYPSVSRTFYLSPSASRSSGAYSQCSFDSNGSSDETQSTMPHTTFDAPFEHRFLPLDTADLDYFSSAIGPTDPANETAQLRPHSGDSGRSEGAASPLSFARWARRHHHHHSNNHNRNTGGEPHKPKGRDRGSAERKTSSRSGPKRLVRSKSTSFQKRQAQAPVVPQMTREEFEALPLAIQRKYFSTLERLRFAQESGLVDGISQHYDDITNFKRRKPRQDRDASDHLVGRSRRGSVSEFRSPTSDSSPLCVCPAEATLGGEVCHQSQVAPAIRKRASVILDAADEAVYKLKLQASKKNVSTSVDVLTPPLSPARDSMDSQDGFDNYVRPDDGPVPKSFYDSFRWMDEEEDLDLRLFLDDYHANLREGAPTTKQRPSFRRHMSISKAPFGRRSSISSIRPGTRDAMTPTSPIHSPTGSVSNGLTHARRKSRTLSLIASKHAAQPSITAFDPAAAHYQDPEARLKLRVYLASPQKFDEAVEFGFPSADVLSAAPAVDTDAPGLSRGQPKQKLAEGPSNMRTFLADHDDDDRLSLSSDQPSLADPDSPKTPEPFEHRPGVPRHARFASTSAVNGRVVGRTPLEGGFYAQAPASSREMTLRMTLTRPDLRAHEDEIYGWQQRQVYQQHSRRPTAVAALATENRGAYLGLESQKGSLEKLPEVDHWNEPAAEKGVMRRIWNRVRRG